MSGDKRKFNWIELLFPIYSDLKNINDESSTNIISNNNWDLVNENSQFKYTDVIKKINDSRNEENIKEEHKIIIVK
jgi:hypothetical protein